MKKLMSIILALAMVFPLTAGVAAASPFNFEKAVSATVRTQSGSEFVSATFYRDQSEGVVEVANMRREEAGLTPLEWNEDLVGIAITRGLESIVYFSHTRPNGEEWYTISKLANGENLATGDTNYIDVMDGWMNSPGHKNNILDTDYISMAAACLEASDGRFYWVQIFSIRTESKPMQTKDSDEIVALVKNAVATSSGNQLNVPVKNAGSITASGLTSIASAAMGAGKSVTLYADTLAAGGTAVTGRLWVDPAGVAVTGDLKLGVYVDNAYVNPTKILFEKCFSNRIAIVGLAHQSAFGTKMQVAAKVDLSGLNTGSLVFYRYDRSANLYTKIANPGYSIDSNGYLHFYTDSGGDIIITDSPLQSR